LNKEAEGLDYPPMPGALGQKVYENISKEAWQMWINHQTILINEHRLSLMEPQARKFLTQEMEKFLFGEGSALPDAYRALD
jgi:Fe-S cluster biosynthesis and repair protein YggX